MDKLIPLDVYLSGCPPKPEAVIDAITKLRKKISREIYEDRIKSQWENRCFTANHKFHVGCNTHTKKFGFSFIQLSYLPQVNNFKLLNIKEREFKQDKKNENKIK